MSKEINNPLSNYSYINKDFNAVWSELLTTVGKLSAKWDPNASNESDPGVVLIKVIALLADKCNYNIDTNALELFPSTVAQSANAREIFEQLGYSMKWYKGGTGKISIKYVETTTENTDASATTTTSSTPATITIPRFTMICDDNNEAVYTIKSPTRSISTSDTLDTDLTFEVIQGIVKDYTYLGETQVTAEQLDSHYRLYFTENNVAQNGIFITNTSNENWDEWSKVDNLNTQDIGSKVYKFGVSRDNVPYIEFPTDIASLIPDGIYLKYIVCDGLAGNVANGVLTKFYNNPTVDVEMSDGTSSTLVLTSDNTLITQSYAIMDGADPESINSAYNNYSKTVGVFDTLVSLRDYVNAIYTLGLEQELTSNVIVTDRTNDIQSSYNIITENNGVEYLKLHTALKDSATYASSDLSERSALMKNPFDTDGTDTENPYGGATELGLEAGEIGDGNAYENPADLGDIDTAALTLRNRDITSDDYEISPFDLKLYLLHYSASPSSSTDNYNKTFIMVNNNESEDQMTGRIDDNVVTSIINQIDDYKSIQHDFVPLLNNRPCIFLNQYPVKAIIVPQYKLTTIQATDISTNIYTALLNKFNSQNISFGEEVLYDSIYDTIMGSDERIKSVILEPLTFTTAVMFFSSYPEDYTTVIDGTEYTVLKDSWNLLPFTINTTIKDYSGNAVAWGVDCYAKSVLAGVTDLYTKDTNFNYSMNQKVIVNNEKTFAENVQKVSTKADVTVPLWNEGTYYKVRDNENIFFQCPNYIDDVNYSTSIKFEYYFPETGLIPTESAIAAENDYEIKDADGKIGYLVMYWKNNDNDNFYTYKIFRSGTKFKTTGFNIDTSLEHSFSIESGLHPLVDISGPDTGKISSDMGEKYQILLKYSGSKTNKDDTTIPCTTGNMLSSSKSITTRKLNSLTVTLDDDNYFYWILNTSVLNADKEEVYRLFTSDGETSYQLKTDEYFLIANKDLSGLRIYGSGTKLERAKKTEEGRLNWNWDAKVTDVSDMNQMGVKVLQKVWVKLPQAAVNCNFSMTEMNFIVLGSGAGIAVRDGKNTYNLSQDPTPILSGDIIKYRADDTSEWTEITQLGLTPEQLLNLEGWSMFSRLNVNLSAKTPQVLHVGQSMIFEDENGEKYKFQPQTGEKFYIQSSETLEREGDTNVSTLIQNAYTEEAIPLNIYGYTETQSENNTKVFDNFTAKLLYNDDMKETAIGNQVSQSLTFQLPTGKYIFPVYIETNDMRNLIIQDKTPSTESFVELKLLNKFAPNSVTADKKITIFSPVMGTTYYISLTIKSAGSVAVPVITLDFSIKDDYAEGKTQALYISKMLRYAEKTYLDEDGNPRYLLGEDFFTDVLNRVQELDYNGIYNFTHEVDEDTYIDDPLEPSSFNKENHIFNKFTICKIDFPKSSEKKAHIIITNKIK